MIQSLREEGQVEQQIVQQHFDESPNQHRHVGRIEAIQNCHHLAGNGFVLARVVRDPVLQKKQRAMRTERESGLDMKQKKAGSRL